MARKKNRNVTVAPVCDDMNFISSEAFNTICANLRFSKNEEKKALVVAITSSIPGEGKTHCAINTAYSFAKSGKKTLLIDCDLRKPKLASRLKLKSSPGMSEILCSVATFEAAMYKNTPIVGLDLLTSGSIPPNPIALLQSRNMKELIAAKRNDYDYIVIDMPPVTSVSDVLALSDLIDGVILVVREGHSLKKNFEDTVRQLKMAEMKILGVIYNGYSLQNTNHYYQSYKYYYR